MKAIMEHVIYATIIVVLVVLFVIEIRNPKCQCCKKHGDSLCCGGCVVADIARTMMECNVLCLLKGN